VSPSDVDHARVRFDADDRAAALNEEARDDPGTTADIHDGARFVGKEVVEQLRGITRTSAVILGSVLAERPGTRSILEDHAEMMAAELSSVATTPARNAPRRPRRCMTTVLVPGNRTERAPNDASHGIAHGAPIGA
jgi:hypothetical protein